MFRFFFTVEEHRPEEDQLNKMSGLHLDLPAQPTEANLVQLEKNMLGILKKDGHEVSNVHIYDYKVLV